MVALTNREFVLSVRCNTCDKPHTLLVDMRDLVKWKTGTYIQDAMPYLNTEDRELLISGICGDCFDNMFSNEEDS